MPGAVVGDLELDLAESGQRAGSGRRSVAPGSTAWMALIRRLSRTWLIWPGLHQIVGQRAGLDDEADLLLADLVADHLDGQADGLVGVDRLVLGLVEPGEVAEPGDDLADPVSPWRVLLRSRSRLARV